MGRRKERKLYSKVMRAIAEVILSDHYDGDDEGFDHFCESAKEHAAKILVSVKGAFYPMPDGRKEYQYGNYLRIEDPSVIEKNAYLQELVTTKHLDEAVRAFFGICSYDFLGSKTNALEVGELWGPNPRLEFKPDIYWKPLFDSFAENGFGRWTGDSFCWDERIQQYL